MAGRAEGTGGTGPGAGALSLMDRLFLAILTSALLLLLSSAALLVYRTGTGEPTEAARTLTTVGTKR
jgi:hypothetical protein